MEERRGNFICPLCSLSISSLVQLLESPVCALEQEVKGQIEFPSPLDTGFKDEYVHSSPQGFHYLGREPDMILWKNLLVGARH